MVADKKNSRFLFVQRRLNAVLFAIRNRSISTKTIES